MLLITLGFSSCRNQYIPIWVYPGLNDEPTPHTHNWVLSDYTVTDGVLYLNYTCDSCDDTKIETGSYNVITASAENIDTEIKGKNNIFVAVTPDTAQNVLDAVGENCTILLGDGDYTNGIKISARENSIDSTVRNLTIIGSENTTIGPGMNKGILLQASNGTLNIDGLNFVNLTFNASKGFPNSWGVTSSSSVINDVNYIGCTFIGNGDTSNNSTNIALNPHAGDNLIFKNFSIEDCTFEKYYEIFYSSTIENLTVRNCKIEDSIFGINVNGNNNSGNFIFNGNTFTNMRANPYAMFNLSNAEIIITDNNFYGEQPNSIVYIHNNTGENVKINANNNRYEGVLLAEASGDISNMTDSPFAIKKDSTLIGTVK